MLILTLALAAAVPHAMPGEEAIDPYIVAPANAGARPFAGDAMARAFHGRPGIRRIVDRASPRSSLTTTGSG